MIVFLTDLVQKKWFFDLAVFVYYWYARIFHDLKVEGKENVPLKGGLVVVSNHISSLDPPTLGSSLPRETHFMAKKELFEGNPWKRMLVLGLRAYPVDREGNASGAIKDSIRKLEKDLAIGIFIQGTRNEGDAKALDGASFIAQRAGVPLLPTAIWKEGRNFRVRFGKPILPKGKSREEMSALTSDVMEQIKLLLPPSEEMDKPKS
jgi:1-acyl-sn-glycerol-3-phosphate acyltransferase